MTDEERANPERYPDNYGAWTQFFRDRPIREFASYDGP
jgi:hypothetical protein